MPNDQGNMEVERQSLVKKPKLKFLNLDHNVHSGAARQLELPLWKTDFWVSLHTL